MTVFTPIQRVLSLLARTWKLGCCIQQLPSGTFQLSLVPPLNAAILEVMGEGMLDVPLSTASDPLTASGPLLRPFQRIDRGQVLHPCKCSKCVDGALGAVV